MLQTYKTYKKFLFWRVSHKKHKIYKKFLMFREDEDVRLIRIIRVSVCLRRVRM